MTTAPCNFNPMSMRNSMRAYRIIPMHPLSCGCPLASIPSPGCVMNRRAHTAQATCHMLKPHRTAHTHPQQFCLNVPKGGCHPLTLSS
mmetsp:Transcript_5814/g.10090  ORF Transcript_5814/g.10090 Transcript_5814/m.10090 type:complete len:88 (-) Transcript_5814:2763-3026(-)